jgi:homoserine O-acetyltransferase
MSDVQSSDDQRTAKPLHFARMLRLEQPFALETGGELPELEIAYETWGKLSRKRDNAILVCHALSGDSHAVRHDENDDPGWWEIMVGPGRPVDTDRYFVVCANVVGGCRGSTGPTSIDPRTGRPYGAGFPTITVFDMIEAQRRLVDHLGIEHLHAVIGGSLGGHQVLAWAARYGDRIDSVIPMATSARLTSQAVAFDVVGRNAICRDPRYAEGAYAETGEKPRVGLALARMLGHITYLSPNSMAGRFDDRTPPRRTTVSSFEQKFSVGSYLAHQGERFVERFDANSYMTLSMAMDVFDLGATGEDLEKSLAAASCRWLLVSYSSDWLFPPYQSREIVEALIRLGADVSYCEVESDGGHDAFLLEDEIGIYGELVRGFLAPDPKAEPTPEVHERSTALIGSERVDYEMMMKWIEPGASVLDLGCGTGGLLRRLRDRGHDRLMGVELDEEAIIDCVRRGLPVVHANIDDGLGSFGEDQFDFVVLSQTLQSIPHVGRLLRAMLRVGHRAIVSFPNVAWEENRRRFAEEGRTPAARSLGGQHWANTPPIHVFSMLDFEELCAAMSLRIEARIALDTRRGEVVELEPNRYADLAVYRLAR